MSKENSHGKLANVHKIFDDVIDSIDKSRGQILDIVDEARKEYELLKRELDKINDEMDQAIANVDNYEMKDKVARSTLAKVSRDFKNNSEQVIKSAYEKATEIRIAYVTAQNEEKLIREKRSRIELAIKSALRNIQNAEQVVQQVSIVASYLKGEIMNALEGASFGNDMMMGVRILEAQENERTRISRDIHDGPAQMVANIVMKADLCEKIARKDLSKGLVELSGLRKAARGALKEVRDIIYNLRPMALDDLGLNKTIEMNVKAMFEGTDVEVEFNLSKMKVDVESIIQVAIFRVTQEILNNIKKHAQANRIFITIDYGSKYMRVVIGDDGVGFNKDATLERVKTEKKNYGLLGIIERVEQLQGDIDINSESGLGSVFTIKLPINREVILDE